MDSLAAAADALRDADSAVALTGAGVSAPSGVPPFRGEDGIWSEYDPDAFHVGRLRRDPAGFWANWLDLRAELFDADVEPNAAHRALADLATAGHLDAVVTQNVDGLHRDALPDGEDGAQQDDERQAGAVEGSPDAVIELHGDARRAACRDCGREVAASEAHERAASGGRPPQCESCDGVLEPDAVLFGERLPADALARARRLVEEGDAMVVAGSSLAVEPAASLPDRAARTGATLVVVNREETPVDARADHVFRADVTEVLPALRDAVVE